MSAGQRLLEVDPTAYERLVLTLGVDSETQALLSRMARTTSLIIGARVADAVWPRVDMIVVRVDAGASAAATDLTSPARAAQLMALIETLYDAGNRGVERVVVEETTTTQPHSSVLRAFCDLYLTRGGSAEEPTARPLSPLARALARAHRRRANDSKEAI